MLNKFVNKSTNSNKVIKPITAQQILQFGVSSWVVTALIGQSIFAIYIFIVFGGPIVTGTINESSFNHVITGFVSGDEFGNAVMFSHILPAAMLSLSGILQIIPHLRRCYPLFHRFNGRFFLTLGLTGALTGLYLTWMRGSRLSDIGAIGITINGLLIPIAVYFAWKYARIKRFNMHQRWAIHAFLLINGVWAFRILLMVWYMLNQGPNGNTENIDGPADIALSFGCYAIPMIVAELVFWAKRQPKTETYKVVLTSIVVVLGCLATALGVVAAAMYMWYPSINKVLTLTMLY